MFSRYALGVTCSVHFLHIPVNSPSVQQVLNCERHEEPVCDLRMPSTPKHKYLHLLRHEEYADVWEWVKNRATKEKISVSLCVEKLLKKQKEREETLSEYLARANSD